MENNPSALSETCWGKLVLCCEFDLKKLPIKLPAYYKKKYLKRFAIFPIKSDGQEISTIEWEELKNLFPSFFVHK